MTLEINKIRKSRRGVKCYESNPFLPSTNLKQGVRKIISKDGDKMMFVSGSSGEIAASAGFWQAEEVDKAQFIKLYVNGVKAFKGLTGSGTKVFEILYLEIQKNIGRDIVHLSFSDINQAITPLSKATFMKGMKELILKGFIAESITQGKYYLNPDYIWNGDRLAFIKEYRKKQDEKQSNPIINTSITFEN